MTEQYSGAIDLRNKSVVVVLNGGKAEGYEAKKAEKFFETNPEAFRYAKDLIEFLSPEQAQGRFVTFCKFSKPTRELARDLFLQEIKEKKERELALAQ